jgi:hypothetical protein
MTTTINHPDDTRHHDGEVDNSKAPDPEVPERSAGRRQFSAKYKAKDPDRIRGIAPICSGRAAASGGALLVLNHDVAPSAPRRRRCSSGPASRTKPGRSA